MARRRRTETGWQCYTALAAMLQNVSFYTAFDPPAEGWSIGLIHPCISKILQSAVMTRYAGGGENVSLLRAEKRTGRGMVDNGAIFQQPPLESIRTLAEIVRQSCKFSV